MLTRPSGYLAALAGAHRTFSRVDVYSGAGVLLQEGLPFIDGSVTATLVSRVARRLALSTVQEFYPDDVTDLLAPFGNELRAFRGIEFGDRSTAVFPVFRGRVNTVALASNGQVAVDAVDRAGDIGDAEFEVPHVAIAGPVVDEFRRLIGEVFPDAVFSLPDPIGEQTPQLIWESDRAKALDDLADTAGAFWYPLANGTFTMRLVQWAQEYAPMFALADGVGGTILNSEVSRTRDNVLNSVTVLSERTDGTAPVRFTARDNDPLSPTYYLGPFGVKSRQVSIQSVISPVQAQVAAETFLRRSRALTETWRLECVPDASIELGDTVTLRAKGREVVQVVAGFTLPLAAGKMTVDLRQQTPGVI